MRFQPGRFYRLKSHYGVVWCRDRPLDWKTPLFVLRVSDHPNGWTIEFLIDDGRYFMSVAPGTLEEASS